MHSNLMFQSDIVTEQGTQGHLMKSPDVITSRPEHEHCLLFAFFIMTLYSRC